MHLRRALLLFAIVLGTAALAASLSRPVEQRRDGTATTPTEREPATATPRAGSAPAAPLALDSTGRQTVRMGAGEAATLEVSVNEPGTVAIPELGLSANAGELTPARFDLFAESPGTYRVTFTPAAGDQAEPAGRLVVTSGG